MGFLSWLTGRSDLSPLFDAAAQIGPEFAVDEQAVPPSVFGLASYASPVAAAPRVSRKDAMQVPGVKRSRDLIAGSIGGLPLDLHGPDKQPVRSRLLEQPESDVPRSVTMTRTVEDVLFEGRAWWRILEFGWHGYPVRVKRLDPSTVAPDDKGRVYVNGQWVQDSELIRFDTPNDPLLVVGARAIRTCLLLDAAAGRASEGAPPIDYFTPTDDTDPADDEEIIAILNAWQAARQKRSTGYVPSSLKYNIAGWNPEQLQLADQRQHAVLEIARLAGVDPEDLGVSTTSRTYANSFDRRKAFIDFTLGPYMRAIEDRLSMGDVTPRGYYVRHNLDAFLRSDTLGRYQAYQVGIEVGAIDPSEIRGLEDRPTLTAGPAPIAALDNVPAIEEASL